MNMMLTIDDAVKVAMQYIHDNCDDYGIDREDEELMYQNMEQKIWVTPYEDPELERMIGFIMDVNPAEICSQIQNENLKKWCTQIQVEMQLCLMRIKEK